MITSTATAVTRDANLPVTVSSEWFVRSAGGSEDVHCHIEGTLECTILF